jgi:hypothetical protein
MRRSLIGWRLCNSANSLTVYTPGTDRARDIEHAAHLYRIGASDAVAETIEASLQLSEAVLVDGLPRAPTIYAAAIVLPYPGVAACTAPTQKLDRT